MQFKSSVLGMVEVDENTVLTFPGGLPAFESCTRFKLFHEEGADPKVFWMQSLDDENVMFSVVDARDFAVDYQIELTEREVATLGLNSPEDAAILLMVYKKGEEETTLAHPVFGDSSLRVNMRNPLIVNTNLRIGLQKVGLKCNVTFFG